MKTSRLMKIINKERKLVNIQRKVHTAPKGPLEVSPGAARRYPNTRILPGPTMMFPRG